jgi:carbohydrate diacid regulator
MDHELAEKIIGELLRFSDKKYALTNQFGEVLAKTDNFTLDHNPLDIKSKRILPINFESKKIGYLYIDENLALVQESGNILKSMAELIIHQNYFSGILTSDEKRIDQLTYDFFRTESVNANELKQIFNSFDINLSKNRLVILLEVSDPSFLFLEEKEIITGEREKKIIRVKREIKYLLSSFYTHHQDNLVSYLGANYFIILKDMGDNPEDYQEEFKKTLNTLFSNIKNELRADIAIGVGSYKSGILGLKESFDEAQTALRFGKQIWGGGNIFHFDNFGVVAPLFSGVTERNISSSIKIIEKLSAHPELLESLTSYFENDISLSKTAKKLKIHRNTLVYRLEKISEITNLNPRTFNDAFQLQLALILDEYGDKNGE